MNTEAKQVAHTPGPSFEAELDEIAKAMRVVPRKSLDNPLVENHLALHETIMLHRDSRFTRGTHFRRYVETDGSGARKFYIRMGKRGQCKRYLESCDVTYLNGEPTLFQYRTARAALSKAGG
jgi:hypothetical protein